MGMLMNVDQIRKVKSAPNHGCDVTNLISSSIGIVTSNEINQLVMAFASQIQ